MWFQQQSVTLLCMYLIQRPIKQLLFSYASKPTKITGLGCLYFFSQVLSVWKQTHTLLLHPRIINWRCNQSKERGQQGNSVSLVGPTPWSTVDFHLFSEDRITVQIRSAKEQGVGKTPLRVWMSKIKCCFYLVFNKTLAGIGTEELSPSHNITCWLSLYKRN